MGLLTFIVLFFQLFCILEIFYNKKARLKKLEKYDPYSS